MQVPWLRRLISIIFAPWFPWMGLSRFMGVYPVKAFSALLSLGFTSSQGGSRRVGVLICLNTQVRARYFRGCASPTELILYRNCLLDPSNVFQVFHWLVIVWPSDPGSWCIVASKCLYAARSVNFNTWGYHCCSRDTPESKYGSKKVDEITQRNVWDRTVFYMSRSKWS